MSTNRSVEERVGGWARAYNAVSRELTPVGLRAITEMASTNDPAGIQLGMAAARIVFANDRTAAVVAAMLTQSGVSRQTYTPDGDE